jgi:hypothetical protein
MVLLPVPLLGEVIELLRHLLQAHIDGDHLLLDRPPSPPPWRLAFSRLPSHLKTNNLFSTSRGREVRASGLVLGKAEPGDLYTRTLEQQSWTDGSDVD